MLASNNKLFKINPYKRSYTLLEEINKSDFLCFDVFFNEGPFAIVVLDKNFHVKRLNGRFDYIFGLKGGDLVGRDIFEFLNTEDAYRLRGIFENRQTSKKPLLIELGFKHTDKKYLKIETFVKKYINQFKEQQYCLLLFDKEFYPHEHWVELQKEVFQAIVDTQEQERHRIGTQLHDSVAQILYAIKLNIHHLEQNHTCDEEVHSIKKLLNEAILQIRHISTDLVPAVLHDFGLKAAIQFMINRISLPDFQVKSKIPAKIEELDENLKLVIYRIIQELLNNCLKHSDATKVQVKIVKNTRLLKIEVIDNGIGFNEDFIINNKKGTGLRSIKNRIDLYQGEIKVLNLDEETKVEVKLNLLNNE
ncbi:MULTISPECIES: ATP-binding protein [Sphingobacterium]|uniref:sensor histidine kinase n=1 Tax=Sphingobacterium TaxID=28453 RepID=UPI000C0BE1AB|nr:MULTISPECIES: ATP-binding protein [Sphingobacterium]MCT1531576.1 histidine kinase [Sphingobacterium daejeonense]